MCQVRRCLYGLYGEVMKYVPMLRNFLRAQVNVTKGRVDETVPCDRQLRAVRMKTYRGYYHQCGELDWVGDLGMETC